MIFFYLTLQFVGFTINEANKRVWRRLLANGDMGRMEEESQLFTRGALKRPANFSPYKPVLQKWVKINGKRKLYCSQIKIKDRNEHLGGH